MKNEQLAAWVKGMDHMKEIFIAYDNDEKIEWNNFSCEWTEVSMSKFKIGDMILNYKNFRVKPKKEKISSYIARVLDDYNTLSEDHDQAIAARAVRSRMIDLLFAVKDGKIEI